MKKILALCLIFTMAVCLFSACTDNKQLQKETDNFGKIIYVSPLGNDNNDGTADAPLLSLNGAVEFLRKYKSANGLPEGGVKIEFASGNYFIDTNITLNDKDSGEEEKPIVFTASEGADVTFNGGVALDASAFSTISDENVLSILKNDIARSNILVIDLADDKYSSLFSENVSSFIQELSVNGKTETQARWPNGSDALAEIVSGEGDYSLFSLTDEQIATWSHSATICWHGYGKYDWADSVSWMASVDAENGVLQVPNKDISYSPTTNGMPFYVFNLLCELDEPGEYYFDATAKKLYYWPTTTIDESALYLSANSTGAFVFDDASYISISGIVFENFTSDVICGKTSHFSFSNSVIRCCSGNCAININGSNITVDGCEFYDLSKAVIRASGGNAVTRDQACCSITNNHFYHFGRLQRAHTDAITTYGCGFYIAHNEIHDTPAQCITVSSAQTVIEYNEIYDAVKTACDAGAIYSGRRWDWDGIVIRYNYIHDIYCYLFDGHPNAIYFDDCLSGGTCYSNIIVNTGGGINLCGGRYLIAHDNVLVNVDGSGINMDARGMGWARYHVNYDNSSNPGYMWKQVIDNYQSDIWRYCLPEMLVATESDIYFESDDSRHYITPLILDGIGTPAYCQVYNNIGYDLNRVFEIHTKDYYPDNHVFDEYDGYTIDGVCNVISWDYLFNTIENNILYSDDLISLFVDPENNNFFLKEDSRVYRDLIGFEKWDYKLIGIQK